jgi:LysM repeat protein
MNKRSSAPARLLAVIALVLAFVVAVVVIGGALGDSEDSGTRRQGGGAARQAESPRREAPASYVVESGDTLTSIAHATGVSVARIEALNPDVDPQILIAGETLKLR